MVEKDLDISEVLGIAPPVAPGPAPKAVASLKAGLTRKPTPVPAARGGASAGPAAPDLDMLFSFSEDVGAADHPNLAMASPDVAEAAAMAKGKPYFTPKAVSSNGSMSSLGPRQPIKSTAGAPLQVESDETSEAIFGSVEDLPKANKGASKAAAAAPAQSQSKAPAAAAPAPAASVPAPAAQPPAESQPTPTVQSTTQKAPSQPHAQAVAAAAAAQKAELEQLRKTVVQLRNRVDELELDAPTVAELQKQLKESKEAAAKYKRENEDLSTRLRESVEELSKLTSSSQTDIADGTRRLTVAQNAQRLAEERLTRETARSTQLAADVERLTAEAQELQAVLAKSRAEVETLRGSLFAEQVKYKQLKSVADGQASAALPAAESETKSETSASSDSGIETASESKSDLRARFEKSGIIMGLGGPRKGPARAADTSAKAEADDKASEPAAAASSSEPPVGLLDTDPASVKPLHTIHRPRGPRRRLPSQKLKGLTVRIELFVLFC